MKHFISLCIIVLDTYFTKVIIKFQLYTCNIHEKHDEHSKDKQQFPGMATHWMSHDIYGHAHSNATNNVTLLSTQAKSFESKNTARL